MKLGRQLEWSHNVKYHPVVFYCPNTGGQVEYTKALERRVLKELGKLPPYLRKKEAPYRRKSLWGAQARG